MRAGSERGVVSSEPFFLAELPDPLPTVGNRVVLDGPEGRHAAAVRRIRVGETLVLTDGRGRGVHGLATALGRDSVTVEVLERLASAEPAVRFVVAQALAKGDRAELAVEMLTEIGVAEVVPWQASRSIVRWTGERGAKGRHKWQLTAREAAKQSRRLRVPVVADLVGIEELAKRVASAQLALVLHEGAERPLRDVTLPAAGTVLVVVGPEGGIADDEREQLVAAGATAVVIGDGVLRTSTAGVVACAALMLR